MWVGEYIRALAQGNNSKLQRLRGYLALDLGVSAMISARGAHPRHLPGRIHVEGASRQPRVHETKGNQHEGAKNQGITHCTVYVTAL